MWTILNNVDISGDTPGKGTSVPGETLNITSAVSDPMATATFNILDPGALLQVVPWQPIVIIDETSTASTNPTHNLVFNPTLVNPLANDYTLDNPANVTITALNPGVQFVASNSVGTGSDGMYQQNIASGYVAPGVQYMLSGYLTISVACAGCAAQLSWNWYDAAGQALSGGPFFQRTATTSQIRVNCSAVAPAGAASARIFFGISVSVSGTNSGTVTWNTLQFEPMWFAAKGQAYPSPDCNGVGSPPLLNTPLPDGTTIRQDRKFAGYVVNAQATYEGTLRTWSVTCNSLSSLLETFFLANANFNATFDSVIISTLLSSNYQIPGTGNHTGTTYQLITTNHVVQMALVDYISIDYNTMREVMNNLAGQSGAYFYVDPYFDLHYAPPGYERCQFGLAGNGTQPNASPTDGSLPTYPFLNYTWTSDGTQLKNRIVALGGKFVAPAITDSFTGNGTIKDFTLSHQPVDVKSVTVAGANQQTGVSGIDQLGVGGYVALIEKTGPKLHFQTAPANGAAVAINYTYEKPVVTRSRDLGSIATFGGRIFDGKVNDTALISLATADQRALVELLTYSQNRVLVTLTAQQPLVAGQMIEITSNYDGMVRTPLLIQTVTTRYVAAGIYEYDGQLGAYNPNLANILMNIHKAVTRNTQTAGSAVIQEEHVLAIENITYREWLNSFKYPDAVFADSPIAYYRLVDATDVTSNHYNGVVNGTVTFGQTGALTNDPNPAALFDGSTGWIRLPTNVNGNLQSAFSVELWQKLSTSSLGSFTLLLAASTGADAVGYQLEWSGTTALFFEVGNGTTFGRATYTTNAVAGQWLHLVGTYDGSNVRLYVNGVLQATTAYSGGAISTTNNPAIGALSGGGDFFPGTIDEVAIYNSALSGTRVAAHYTAGTT